ncbi:PQQ-dependent sugar dehydrogenase [Pseudomonas typographi]|uniref:Sorbosone dehydrogenase family protein n=1 Tax=Pseudomonas typographi TaxID=2715964 RepID=A0ABR7Z3D5_9PSED|nr:sorbosone dehydrogenase family protein [Pseudomonas typographi]MBD1551961.1 sorbosone dehydrogenase family protein [Pseudomonas typographi]MBD1586525.1 sorbosone dehydrogenase family protein [Pseudomonas typographi]MBD1600026.1 sorbosone dehydrogenase family protein [Pseudomonas typographi]
MRHALLPLCLLLAGTAQADGTALPAGFGPNPTLPAPEKSLIPTVNTAPAVGWPQGAKPVAAPGTQVAAFAEGLDHPRWLYVLPNGDVLVAETNSPPKPDDNKGLKGLATSVVMSRAGANVPSPNRISLLRDRNGDGVAETRTVFLQGLNSPFGMALVGNSLYVAASDALLRYTYTPGATSLEGPGEKVVDLPAGKINHHWTKNVIASADGKKLYVTVGSNSNAAENGLEAEEGRAAIWEVDPASKQQRLFASGLRNPNGLAWNPQSGKLWAAVNERDELGNDLVPDYITSVKDGGFYGWPFSYWGQHVDTRVTPGNSEKVQQAIAPDYAVGAHTASLGLMFAEQGALPAPFDNGAIIGQHGSWNRKPHSGYKVLFVPFTDGKPNGAPVDLLTGFLDKDENALGRPVGVVGDHKGGVLVADDVGNKVWRITAAK